MHFKHWCDGEKVNWKLRVFAHFQPFWVCFYKLIWIPFSNIWWYQTGVLLFCIWCLVCKVELDLLALRNGVNVGQNQWMVSQSVFLTICWYGFPERFAMLPLGLCHLLIIWDGTWSRCEFLACLLGKVYGKCSCSVQGDQPVFADSSLLRFLVTVPCYKLIWWTPHLNISF